MKKKKGNTPRRKRLNREQRLEAGKNWLKTYKGKKHVKAYANWFGVDKQCAITELRKLGITITREYEDQIKHNNEVIARKRKAARERKDTLYDDPYMDVEMYGVEFEFIAGFTEGGMPYGVVKGEYNEDEDCDLPF